MVCFFAVGLKGRLGYDDSLDVVGVHMVGGVTGALLTGVFATLAVNPAGADGSLAQVGRQAIAVGVTFGFSFVATLAILKMVDLVMRIRVTPEEEEEGLDVSEHGEVAYTLPGTVAAPRPDSGGDDGGGAPGSSRGAGPRGGGAGHG